MLIHIYGWTGGEIINKKKKKGDALTLGGCFLANQKRGDSGESAEGGG